MGKSFNLLMLHDSIKLKDPQENQIYIDKLKKFNAEIMHFPKIIEVYFGKSYSFYLSFDFDFSKINKYSQIELLLKGELRKLLSQIDFTNINNLNEWNKFRLGNLMKSGDWGLGIGDIFLSFIN